MRRCRDLLSVAPRTRSSSRTAPLSVVLAAITPLVVAACWIPIRTRLPNVDLSLVLIALVALIGTLGSRVAIGGAAVSAALWFEFFDTVPFERLTIARNPDVETTLILAIVAAMVGELSSRVARHRTEARSEARKLASMRSAAELVASGEELVRVIESVVAELVQLLGLRTCEFESAPSAVARPTLTRDGELVGTAGRPVPLRDDCIEVELPVTVQGSVLGRFLLGFDEKAHPPRDLLLVALTLADNVGAAFLAQAPPPVPPGKEPVARLSVVDGDRGDTSDEVAAAGTAGGGRDQETAGFSWLAG